MRRIDHLKRVEYLHGNVLRLIYVDGMAKCVDFGPWFRSPERTPFEKRYRSPEWFSRVKLVDTHAIMWGDHLIVFAADKLRRGISCTPPRYQA